MQNFTAHIIAVFVLFYVFSAQNPLAQTNSDDGEECAKRPAFDGVLNSSQADNLTDLEGELDALLELYYKNRWEPWVGNICKQVTAEGARTRNTVRYVINISREAKCEHTDAIKIGENIIRYNRSFYRVARNSCHTKRLRTLISELTRKSLNKVTEILSEIPESDAFDETAIGELLNSDVFISDIEKSCYYRDVVVPAAKKLHRCALNAIISIRSGNTYKWSCQNDLNAWEAVESVLRSENKNNVPERSSILNIYECISTPGNDR